MSAKESIAARAARDNIAARAAQGSEHPPSVWNFVANDMACRVDVFGSAQEVARSANPALDAAAVNLIQETILEEARHMPLPRLSGEVFIGAEIFREDPFTRYGGPPNGATDARIGWFTNAMVAVTYAVDEKGTCACAGINVTKPGGPNLAEFVREVAGEARCVTSAESRLIANACADAGVPYREAPADAPELSPLRALRKTIAPIMMEATKGAEASYVDGNLRWYSLVSQGCVSK